MKKKLDEIVFSEDSLKKYQHEINEFRKICDDLMNDKSIKKAHKKYLRKKEKEKMKLGYNNIEYAKEYDNKINCNSQKIIYCIDNKKSTYNKINISNSMGVFY